MKFHPNSVKHLLEKIYQKCVRCGLTKNIHFARFLLHYFTASENARERERMKQREKERKNENELKHATTAQN